MDPVEPHRLAEAALKPLEDEFEAWVRKHCPEQSQQILLRHQIVCRGGMVAAFGQAASLAKRYGEVIDYKAGTQHELPEDAGKRIASKLLYRVLVEYAKAVYRRRGNL